MLEALVVLGVLAASILFLLFLLAINYFLNPQYQISFKRRVYRFLFIIFIGTIFSLAGWLGVVGWDSALETTKNRAREVGLFFQRGDARVYDVIVLGGEPEGIAAAVAAARAGGETLLVVQRPRLGGLITYSWLNMLDMNYGPDRELLTRGIFAEFFQAVGGAAFDIKQAEQFFTKLVSEEKKLTVIYRRKLLSPIIGWDRETLVGIKVQHEEKSEKYFARRFVDATQDADLAAAAGVSYTLGAEDVGWDRVMSSTLVFQLAGVDWPAVRHYLAADGADFTGSTKKSAWGFQEFVKDYKAGNDRFRLRSLNLGLQNDGTVMVNALQIFNVDGLDRNSREQAMLEAKAEVDRIVPFLRENVPGFREATLVATAPELYVRETRHIAGEYRLNINDIMENRDFPDRIALASYPVDIQAMSPEDWGYVIGNPAKYAIPLRCLVPLTVENLLVVGRSASFTSLAAGSARVVPVGMVTGQAAGVTAVLSLKKGVKVRDITNNSLLVQQIQKKLVEQGAYLEAFSIKQEKNNHWAYNAVKALRPMGLIIEGYDNKLSLSETISDLSFANLLYQAMERAVPRHVPDKGKIFSLTANVGLYPKKMLEILAVAHGLPEYYLAYDADDLYRLMVERGMIGREFQQHYDPNRLLSRGQAYVLVLDTVRYYREETP